MKEQDTKIRNYDIQVDCRIYHHPKSVHSFTATTCCKRAQHRGPNAGREEFRFMLLCRASI